MTTTAEPKLKEGRIVAISGPVVDAEFPPGSRSATAGCARSA
jgi:hypothetical protein